MRLNAVTMAEADELTVSDHGIQGTFHHNSGVRKGENPALFCSIAACFAFDLLRSHFNAKAAQVALCGSDGEMLCALCTLSILFHPHTMHEGEKGY